MKNSRSKIHYFTFEIYRSKNDFYCRHSYIARYDERIRFNGILMSSNRYIRMSLVLQEISYGV